MKTHATRAAYLRHARETFQLSLPVIVGQLGHIMMGVIDNAMVGGVGYEYLSASGLANGMFFLIIIIGMGIGMALSPLTAEAEGAKNYGLAADYLKQGLVIAVLGSVVLGVATWLSPVVFPYMNQPARDLELAPSYLRILAWGIPAFMLFLTGKHFVDGLSLTRPAMYITLIGLLSNVFMNWLLIYGNWGFPRLELDGAGYATNLSRYLMALLMLGYIWLHPRFASYRQGWEGIHGRIIRKILRIGIPTGLQYFFEASAFVLAAFMVGWLGSAARAAHQIAISMASVTFMVVIGIASGASIRVGDALGRKDLTDIRQAGYTGVMLGVGFMILAAVAFVIGREWLPALFLSAEGGLKGLDSQEVLNMAARLMLFAAVFQVFDGTQAVGGAILRGLQDVRIPTLITLLAYWVVALPLCYLLGFVWNWGLDGVWAAFVICLMVSAVLLLLRFGWVTRPDAQKPGVNAR